MKIYELTLFSTLALSACLPRAVVKTEGIATVDQGDVANVGVTVGRAVAGNNSAVADGADAVDLNEEQDNEADAKEDDSEEDGVQNDNENNVENGNENIDQILNGNLQNGFQDINIDPNDILGSLGQNILDLMLAMGICNFNLNSLQGLGLGNQIQLLLQLQQLQQLQALGVVNSFTVDQLIQREILSQTFNLDIIKRSIDESVQQATRGMKRTAILKRQCANVGQSQDDANSQADQNQVNQGNEKQGQANEGEDEQDQADKGQNNENEEGDKDADAENEEDNTEQDNAEQDNAEQDNEEGVEVP